MDFYIPCPLRGWIHEPVSASIFHLTPVSDLFKLDP